MNYLTVKEAGEKWGLGIRVVSLYCSKGRIIGAVKKSNQWLIPENAGKPEDQRHRKVINQKPLNREVLLPEESHWPFQSLYENKELFAQIIKYFPYPMHICAPDGTMLWANDAYLKFAKISNPEKLYKKHNILQNTDLERWGIKDFVQQAFQGETIHAYDVKVPHQEIVEQLGDGNEPVSGYTFHNMTAFPIRDSNHHPVYIVFIFTTSRYYQDKEEIMKGKEYIDDHWSEAFDIDQLSEVVHMSRYHYTRLFKQHTGMTPYNYYQNVKFGKLKEMLCDNNLSITQAFDECGVDYNGSFAKKFKQEFGMTPFQYRKMMNKK